jgi:periplasmic divalent cation tolerance protein
VSDESEAKGVAAQDDAPVIVYATFPDPAMAEAIGGALLDLRLVACVNILPAMTALYNWKGARQKDSECVGLFKTRRSLAQGVVDEIVARHAYETPAALILPLEGGAEGYLAWLAGETKA